MYWESEIREDIQKLKKRGSRRPNDSAPDETMALVAYYKRVSQEWRRSALMDGLISMYDHNREHSQKMLASLIPVLAMLTASDLEGLLSPDRADPADLRPIVDRAKFVESGMVMYMGLDSLSDSVIANAIASITLADLASHAGARYNGGCASEDSEHDPPERAGMTWRASQHERTPNVRVCLGGNGTLASPVRQRGSFV